jgi:sugar (pentulose or hexulose) kinase
MSFLVALDAGTGGAKCTVFDLHGHLRALRSQAWTYSVVPHPEINAIKSFSFDPHQFWQILASCTRAALQAAEIRPQDVLGVAATSQREGCVFLDRDGCEVYAGPNLDSRGFAEGFEVLSSLGPQRLYEITGHSAPFIFALARYLWFRKHDPRPVARILMIDDWMTYRLCGAECSEPSNASESMLFDFRQRRWSEEILAQFDVPPGILPSIVESGQRVGSVHAAAAAATGLLEGTPVFAGGADTQCSLLGAGAIEAGDTAVILGTTCPIQAVMATPTLDPAGNLWAGCHVVPDRWVLEANVGGCGDAYQWMMDLLVHGDGDRYARAEEMARSKAPGAGTFTFIGPRLFDLTKIRPDMPGGILFRFPTLQLRPDAGELLRANLESLGFAIRANLETLRGVAGELSAVLFAGGGMTRNSLLLEIIADVTGATVRRTEEAECTGLGCAILAATGAGAYADVRSAAGEMCRHRDLATSRERHGAYEAPYAKWREFYGVLDQLSI